MVVVVVRRYRRHLFLLLESVVFVSLSLDLSKKIKKKKKKGGIFLLLHKNEDEDEDEDEEDEEEEEEEEDQKKFAILFYSFPLYLMMSVPTTRRFEEKDDDDAKKSTSSRGGVVLDNGQFTCKVYDFGAHVVSWRSKSDLEVFKAQPEFLFLSRDAVLDGTKAIRGGIPICFPQFGKLGTCAKQHGFARHSTWDFISSETNADECWAKATFSMSSNEDTLKEFPFKFTLKYTVCIEKEFLHTKLEVTNDDSKEFEFTTALHTYFTAKSINDIAVKGLNGARYTDSLQDGKECVEGEEEIRFDKEVDRIYRRNVALVEKERLEIIDRVWEQEGVLSQHTRGVAMTTKNLNDAVVWNPWIDKSKSMADFGDEEYKEMVCVEAAAIEDPVKLKPGQSWCGEQTLESVINLAHFSA